jgi:hypothetical protein
MRTAGLISSRSARVDTLCGMVMSAPTMFVNLNTARRKSGYGPLSQPMGTTTASMPACSKYGL